MAELSAIASGIGGLDIAGALACVTVAVWVLIAAEYTLVQQVKARSPLAPRRAALG